MRVITLVPCELCSCSVPLNDLTWPRVQMNKEEGRKCATQYQKCPTHKCCSCPCFFQRFNAPTPGLVFRLYYHKGGVEVS